MGKIYDTRKTIQGLVNAMDTKIKGPNIGQRLGEGWNVALLLAVFSSAGFAFQILIIGSSTPVSNGAWQYLLLSVILLGVLTSLTWNYQSSVRSGKSTILTGVSGSMETPIDSAAGACPLERSLSTGMYGTLKLAVASCLSCALISIFLLITEEGASGFGQPAIGLYGSSAALMLLTLLGFVGSIYYMLKGCQG